MRKWGRRFIFSIQFMTRYSLNMRLYLQPSDFPRASVFFPFDGFLIGLGACLFAWLGFLTNSKPFTAVLIVLGYTILTAVFQMNGLAKSFDMLGCRDIDSRREALESSFLQKRGIVSVVVMTTLLSVVVYLLLLKREGIALFTILVVVSTVSKLGIVFSCMIGRNIEREGIGRPFITKINLLDFIGALIVAALITIPLVGLQLSIILFGLQIVIVLIITVIFAFLIHGITQETLGCIHQVGMLMSFCAFLICIYLKVPAPNMLEKLIN